MLKPEWRNLKDLADKNFDGVPVVPGVYFLRWARRGKPVPVGRLGNRDPKGILYVGSGELKRRVRNLWNAITKGRRVHTVGKTVIFCKIFEIINPDEYEVSWEKLKGREASEGEEWAALKLYCDKYKEPPPLNLAIRRKMFGVVGIAEVGKSRVAYEPDAFVRSIIDS